MEYIYSSIIIALETAALLNINIAFLDLPKRKNSIFIMLYMIAMFVFSNFVMKESSILKAVIVIVLSVLLVTKLFKGHIWQKILYCIIWYIAVVISEYVMIFILLFIFKTDLQQLLMNVIAFTILAILSKFSLYFISYTVRKYFNSKGNMQIKHWIQLLIFPVFSIYTCFLLIDVRLKSTNTNVYIFLCSIGLMASNIIIFKIINQLEEEEKIKNDNIILSQRIKNEIESVEQLKEAYSVQRKMTHDFQNHMEVIRGLAAKGNEREIIDYTTHIIGETSSQTMIVNSNNNFIDVILNQKYKAAQKENIVTEYKISDLSNIIIKNEDMVVILSNAIDNAILAASKCKDRYIKISILNNNNEAFISIQNTSEYVDIDNNNVVTNNSNIEHGYGLQNIKGVLSKYDHLYSIKYEKGFFKLTIIVYDEL